ncbi:MAG: copper-translocating P-type ATPase [Burkholderiales bacterium RIFOXYC12_FULL_65_23]|jgi:Cd2+/Zn2+-exporting ATPase|nr:MAG: copper-translocating P-type ATPase [Burkholderiales bacterium RIFOXYC12_FULL_65_23]
MNMNHEKNHADRGCSSCGCSEAGDSQVISLAAQAPASNNIPLFRIPTMDCAVEEGEIRQLLDKVPGIVGLRFQLGARTLAIDAPQDVVAQALAAIRKAGFKPVPATGNDGPGGGHGGNSCSAHDHGHDHPNGHDHSHGKGLTLPEGLPRYGLALLLALGAESLAYFAPDTLLFKGLGMVLAGVAIALAGLSTYIKGMAALRRLRLNINALMTVAVTGAFLIGQWPEAAMVMALYAIAEAIEARAVDRARNAIQSLLAMAPEDAEVRQADGQWLRLPVKAVAVGSTVRIRPGERMPLDGVVTSGQSSVDQSPVTGESLPVDKAPGDEVYAGTINQASSVEIRVTAPAADSTLARIIHAVEQAQASRAPTQRFVDRFAAVYTPGVFLLALAVALLTPWAMGWGWMTALYKALVLLVIACPCALVISTPVTVVSGLAAGARRGILIKGGVHLEGARQLRAVALDKTGTLTEGRPKLVAFEVLDPNDDPAELEALARSLAARSDHPVSQAIAAKLTAATREVDGFQAMAGRGVRGRIDGHDYVLANHRWIEERGQCSAQLEAKMRVHEEAGRSVTILGNSQRVMALLAVADTIKASSVQAVAELRALGVTPVMLTGDNLATARTVAAQAGIDEVRGNLLPEDKLQAVLELKQRFGPVAMAGDGINDAPALAQSDIGFAMGAAGTHTAMEAADVVVMNDDLRRLPEMIRLSRQTHAVLWQNIALALGIKTIFLLLAIFDDASMWMAVFADMGASLLVVFNGLRLLKGSRSNG